MSLSIIIPVHNEIKQLKVTIKKLLTLKKKINFEIIFIDDFSFDGSYEMIKKFQKRSKLIKVFRNPKKGLGSAIETGIKKSRKIYEKYKKKSENLKKITFIGRTGLFKYIDMAPAVNIHIKIANDFIKENYI